MSARVRLDATILGLPGNYDGEREPGRLSDRLRNPYLRSTAASEDSDICPGATAFSKTEARKESLTEKSPWHVLDRLLSSEPCALYDHELLEMLLATPPYHESGELAHALIARFGSLANAISATPHALNCISGLGDVGIAKLKVVHAAALRLVRAEVTKRPILSNWDALTGYLNAVLARERIEQLRLLFLDNRNGLLADEAQGRGTVNHTPVYPREVVKRALEIEASAIILVHNHPSGDPSPSGDDIAMTKELSSATAALSITLHDHIIVGNGSYFSFRKVGML